MLKATFFYQVPCGLFRLFPVRIVVESQARAWTGFHGTLYGNSEDCDMVYITDWESVYHTSPSCTHLDLSVAQVSLEQGFHGTLYGNSEDCDMVYITDWESVYHTSPSCTHLDLSVAQVSLEQAQTGRNQQGERFHPCEMVYITDWESVYHTSPSCTHLDLSVAQVSLEQAQTGRNQQGERFHPCENCIGHGEAHNRVYITQNGTAYHNDVHCGGITRTVRMVKKSETGAFHACERCGGAFHACERCGGGV